MRVLVVEDERDLADAIARGLRRDGYAVDIAHRAAEAVTSMSRTAYDIICLDLNLPDGDGRDVCRRVRSGEFLTDGAEMPRVIMLTARDALDDRVAGLDDGADDYLVKPFALAELLARMRALSRRGGHSHGRALHRRCHCPRCGEAASSGRR